MADIDRTKREVPYFGEKQKQFQSDMGEYRQRRNIIRKALRALKRQDPNPSAAMAFNNLLDYAKDRQLKVTGTDRVDRIEQVVLAQQQEDRENAIQDTLAKRIIQEQSRRDRFPERPERERPKVNIEPTESDEEKQNLQETYSPDVSSNYGIIDENRFQSFI
jgi:hypothetical protein